MWNFLNGGQLHRFFKKFLYNQFMKGQFRVRRRERRWSGSGRLNLYISWQKEMAETVSWFYWRKRENSELSHVTSCESGSSRESAGAWDSQAETVKQRNLLYVSVCCERLDVWRTHILMLWSGVWDGPLSCPSPPLPASARRFTPGTLECSWERVWVCGCAYFCVYITVGKATKLYPFKK